MVKRGFSVGGQKLIRGTKAAVWRTVPILDLQPISRESPDNVVRPLPLVPTVELTKYSFVLTTNMAEVQVKNSIAW